LATMDAKTEELPGDYGAVNSAGTDVFMVSYGAVFIDVRDASGTKYNLAPGTTALLESPIQDPLLANAVPPPPTIPFFTFDPVSGAWLQDAPDLVLNAETYYVKEIDRFSTKNADIEKGSPACIRITVDQGILDLGNLNARVDVAPGTNSTQRKEPPRAD